MAPIKRINLSSAVIEEIRRMIQDGELKAGDQLPTPNNFTEQLLASRIIRAKKCTLSASWGPLSSTGILSPSGE